MSWPLSVGGNVETLLRENVQPRECAFWSRNNLRPRRATEAGVCGRDDARRPPACAAVQQEDRLAAAAFSEAQFDAADAIDIRRCTNRHHPNCLTAIGANNNDNPV